MTAEALPHADDSEPDLLASPSAFVDALGMTVVELSAERVVATLDAGPQHHQPAGLVHGGVWSTVIETLASLGGHLAVRSDGRSVVGVHNATDFLRPHVAGPVRAVAEPLHSGRTQQLWQVVISRDDDGRQLARGQVRLAVVDPSARENPGTAPQ